MKPNIKPKNLHDFLYEMCLQVVEKQTIHIMKLSYTANPFHAVNFHEYIIL